MDIRHRILIVGTGAALIVGLTGCAPQAEAAATATPIPTATPSATPAPSPTPTPTPPPAATCETVFTDAEYAKLEADGLTSRGDAHLDAELQSLVEAGGISCKWVAPGSDIMALYAQWPSDQAGWDTLRMKRLAAGYAEIVDPFPGIIQEPFFDGIIQPALTYRDGVVHWSSYPKLFGSVLALQ